MIKNETHPNSLSRPCCYFFFPLSFSLPSDFFVEYFTHPAVVFLQSSINLKLGLYVSIHLHFDNEISPKEDKRFFDDKCNVLLFLFFHYYSLMYDNLNYVLYSNLSFLGLPYDRYDQQNNGPKDVHVLIPGHMNMLDYMAKGIRFADGIQVANQLILTGRLSQIISMSLM